MTPEIFFFLSLRPLFIVPCHSGRFAVDVSSCANTAAVISLWYLSHCILFFLCVYHVLNISIDITSACAVQFLLRHAVEQDSSGAAMLNRSIFAFVTARASRFKSTKRRAKPQSRFRFTWKVEKTWIQAGSRGGCFKQTRLLGCKKLLQSKG